MRPIDLFDPPWRYLPLALAFSAAAAISACGELGSGLAPPERVAADAARKHGPSLGSAALHALGSRTKAAALTAAAYGRGTAERMAELLPPAEAATR